MHKDSTDKLSHKDTEGELRHKVFVYGTLKEGHGNHPLLYGSNKIGDAWTRDSHFTMTGSGIPFVYDRGCWQIKGELYEVNDETLAHLDRLEGHPQFYERRVYPMVDRDGHEHDAWIYINEGALVTCEEGEPQEYRPYRGYP